VLKIYAVVERVIVLILLLLLILVVGVATLQFAFEIPRRVWFLLLGNRLGTGSAVAFLQSFAHFGQVFGAFLLILIGVELMRTVVTYLERHELHVEVVFTVAMTAIARPAIDVDIEHVDPLALIGMGALILALTLGYFLYRRAVGGDSLE
jgi:uncharacterized membrane protein (DUF373 family)